MQIPEWATFLEESYLGYRGSQWLGLFGIIFLGFLFKSFARYILHILKKLVSRSKTQWDDRVVEAIDKPFEWVYLSLVFYLSVRLFGFEGSVKEVLSVVSQFFLSVGLIYTFYKLSDVLMDFLNSYTQRTDNELDDHLLPLLGKSLKVFILVGGTLMGLQNLGVKVYSLLAGLGIGGLAFALAAKDTAANFFGSIMILIDRPFRVGDWIKIGSHEGTVEEIGFRSTRIRTFYDSQISIPNSETATSHVDNMGRRKFRRVRTTLGVTYDTPPEKMKKFIEGIKQIIAQNPFTRKDYYHVVFNSYGDFNLEVLLYFFLEVPDWSEELKQREEIFFKIYNLAEQLSVEFAFPTQTLHLNHLRDCKAE